MIARAEQNTHVLDRPPNCHILTRTPIPDLRFCVVASHSLTDSIERSTVASIEISDMMQTNWQSLNQHQQHLNQQLVRFSLLDHQPRSFPSPQSADQTQDRKSDKQIGGKEQKPPRGVNLLGTVHLVHPIHQLPRRIRPGHEHKPDGEILSPSRVGNRACLVGVGRGHVTCRRRGDITCRWRSDITRFSQFPVALCLVLSHHKCVLCSWANKFT